MTSPRLGFSGITIINMLKRTPFWTDCLWNLEGPVDLVSFDRSCRAGIDAGFVRVCAGRTVRCDCRRRLPILCRVARSRSRIHGHLDDGAAGD